jgi:hypothetical protein
MTVWIELSTSLLGIVITKIDLNDYFVLLLVNAVHLSIQLYIIITIKALIDSNKLKKSFFE